jgi:hypothetical protein
MTAADYIAKSAPDGHALMLGTITCTPSVATRASLPFDPLNEVIGFTTIGQGTRRLIVRGHVPMLFARPYGGVASRGPEDHRRRRHQGARHE